MVGTYLKYGFWTAVFLILYFLLLRLVSLHTITVLSSFNAVIYGFGIFLAISHYKRNVDKFENDKALMASFGTGFVATVIFTAFMGIYMFHLDPQFAETILKKWGASQNYGPFLLVVSVLIMGLATSAVLTLAFLQLLKDSWNAHQGK